MIKFTWNWYKERVNYLDVHARLRRICSTSEAFERMAADLCTFLVASGCRKAFVLQQIQRASLKTREKTFRPRPRSINNNSANGSNVPSWSSEHCRILLELQPLLLCSDKCKSLGDYVVHAKLNPTRRTGQKREGTVRCGNRWCHVCKYLEPGDRFTSQNTAKSYYYELDCKSSNVVTFCLVKYVMYNTLV